MNAIHRQIQPLNPQIGFNVNSIQRQILFEGLMVEFVYEWHSH